MRIRLLSILCFLGIVSTCLGEFSIEELTRAAEAGDRDAQILLADAYIRGKGVQKNYTEAFKWTLKLADSGDAFFQYRVGLFYALGNGVLKDEALAFKYFARAAMQGLVDAQVMVADAYETGDGIEKNEREALKWYAKAAEQDHSGAEFKLGYYYDMGKVLPQNHVLAAKWYKAAAMQGEASAQCNLATLYFFGRGVIKDQIEGLAWANIAAINGDSLSVKKRDAMEYPLGKQISLLAQQRSKELLVEIEATKKRKKVTPSQPVVSTYQVTKEPQIIGSGSGVFVTDDGMILTAAHVVLAGKGIVVKTKKGLEIAKVISTDSANDVALLKIDGQYSPAPLRASKEVKLGEAVFTIGFPNVDVQGFNPKLTKGDVNSLTGLKDDPREWQISVPVQPGNSGGPLFDQYGNVVGLVVAKLNTINMAQSTGDLPQNVNYAVKNAYAMPMLEPYAAKLPSENRGSWFGSFFTNVIEKATESTVLIILYDRPIMALPGKDKDSSKKEPTTQRGPQSSVQPQKSQSGATSEVDQVTQFFKDFLSREKITSAMDEAAFYADSVDYLDEGIRTKAYILQDIDVYNKRWPTRNYTIRELQKAGDVGNGQYASTFTLDFLVSNETKSRSGTVTGVIFAKRKNGIQGQYEIVSFHQKLMK